MATLAESSFWGTPEDQAKVTDAYKEVSPELRNKLTSNVSTFTSGLGDIFNKVVGIAGNVGQEFNQGAIDLPQAKNRIDRALKGSRGDLLKIAGMAEKVILPELTGVDPNTSYVKTVTGVARQLEVLVGDSRSVVDTFKNGGYDKVSSVVNFISELTNIPMLKMFDLGAEAAILRGVIEEISAWGIPELVDQVLKDQPDYTKYTVIRRAAERISFTSSLDTLLVYAKTQGSIKIGCQAGTGPGDSIGEGTVVPCIPIYQNIGAQALNAQTPDFAMKVLQNLVIPPEMQPNEYPAMLDKLIELMNLLKQDWFIQYRGTEEMWNLGTLQDASEGTVTLFYTREPYRSAMLTAPFYQPRRAEELIDSYYPLVRE